ncbi:MAG TPA: hypothetical protein DCE56_26435 [Cyanobacteria bacterium UBA8553]|nr:hypothetical protein [Cyanobacteria bacterium UBA8553]HAJ61178.1 hypothetical protein [Cyanobacteria bacterium UBA8543]
MKEDSAGRNRPLAQERLRFQVRVPPEQHRALAIKAAEAGVSLNRYVSSKLLA